MKAHIFRPFILFFCLTGLLLCAAGFSLDRADTVCTDSPACAPARPAGTASTLCIQCGDTELIVELIDTPAAAALADRLRAHDLTIELCDDGAGRRTGTLNEPLPANDAPMMAIACDLLLLDGNRLAICLDAHACGAARLGKIRNVSPQELAAALGCGDVTVTISIREP